VDDCCVLDTLLGAGKSIALSKETEMGLGDNRRSPKMSRKISQRKLKERIKRRRVAAAALRSTSKAAPSKKKSK